MVDFRTWCNAQVHNHGAHSLRVLSARPMDLKQGCDAVAAVIPKHYASEERIARNLARLGKADSAEFILQKLPTSKQIRSGDLGEILATEYVDKHTPYSAPIKRLRWKDHRNMAMRGDDVIALKHDHVTGSLHFLKGEAKSRAQLTATVVSEARTGLNKDNGLPSAHSLAFLSDRLLEGGYTDLADAIDDAQLKHGIQPGNVKHMLFTFSGNDPTALLQNDLTKYVGVVVQRSVGLCVNTHTAFIADTYEQVIQNAVLA